MSNWLAPGLKSIRGLRGSVRTVGNPSKESRETAKQQRHRIATPKPSRAAYFRNYNKSPARRAYLAAKKRQYIADRRAAEAA